MFDKMGKQPKHKLQPKDDLDDAYALNMNDDDIEKK
jgi:hypothetical protein